MLDLNKEQRVLLARMENPEAFIYRQAETFYLTIGGLTVCGLNADTCKSLIELGALVELGSNSVSNPDTDAPTEAASGFDITEWVYAADPRCFGPNWMLAKPSDVVVGGGDFTEAVSDSYEYPELDTTTLGTSETIPKMVPDPDALDADTGLPL
jgi:hypothetical protein